MLNKSGEQMFIQHTVTLSQGTMIRLTIRPNLQVVSASNRTVRISFTLGIFTLRGFGCCFRSHERTFNLVLELEYNHAGRPLSNSPKPCSSVIGGVPRLQCEDCHYLLGPDGLIHLDTVLSMTCSDPHGMSGTSRPVTE